MKRVISHLPFTLLLSALWTGAYAGQLPDPAKGGKGGGPIDLLLLRGHAEMDFGRQPKLDETYQEKLAGRGYRVTIASEWQALNVEYLKQLNVVIYLNPSPYLGGGYFDATAWRSGPNLLTVKKNADVLREYVSAGGGQGGGLRRRLFHRDVRASQAGTVSAVRGGPPEAHGRPGRAAARPRHGYRSR